MTGRWGPAPPALAAAGGGLAWSIRVKPWPVSGPAAERTGPAAASRVVQKVAAGDDPASRPASAGPLT